MYAATIPDSSSCQETDNSPIQKTDCNCNGVMATNDSIYLCANSSLGLADVPSPTTSALFYGYQRFGNYTSDQSKTEQVASNFLQATISGATPNYPACAGFIEAADAGLAVPALCSVKVIAYVYRVKNGTYLDRFGKPTGKSPTLRLGP